MKNKKEMTCVICGKMFDSTTNRTQTACGLKCRKIRERQRNASRNAFRAPSKECVEFFLEYSGKKRFTEALEETFNLLKGGE